MKVVRKMSAKDRNVAVISSTNLSPRGLVYTGLWVPTRWLVPTSHISCSENTRDRCYTLAFLRHVVWVATVVTRQPSQRGVHLFIYFLLQPSIPLSSHTHAKHIEGRKFRITFCQFA